MSDHEPSPWARPTTEAKTPQELLEAHYADAENPDNLDDMVVMRKLRDVTPDSFPERPVSAEFNRFEAVEEVGEEALEASGVEDPEGIDEDAHMYTLAELRAMREAARRLVGEEEASVSPLKTELDQLMARFSEDDISHLQFYAIAEQDKIDAQQRGDGQASTEAQQAMAWHQKRMSADAQSTRIQFSNLYDRVNPR